MAEEGTTQNVTARYLKKDRLQEVLEGLFPGQTEFNIRVSLAPSACARIAPHRTASHIGILVADWGHLHAQMKDDQWCFTAPRQVKEVCLRRLLALARVRNSTALLMMSPNHRTKSSKRTRSRKHPGYTISLTQVNCRSTARDD